MLTSKKNSCSYLHPPSPPKIIVQKHTQKKTIKFAVLGSLLFSHCTLRKEQKILPLPCADILWNGVEHMQILLHLNSDHWSTEIRSQSQGGRSDIISGYRNWATIPRQMTAFGERTYRTG